MRKKILAIGAASLLFVLVLVPCINATMLQGETVKTRAESRIILGDNLTKEAENDGESAFGSIYGHVYSTRGWSGFNVPFALVRIGSGLAISNLNGYYEKNNLPLDQEYVIRAYAIGYYSSEPVTIKLSSDNPNRKCNIYMAGSEMVNSLSIKWWFK